MNYFFSVDWGTSSLRVRLINTKAGSVSVINEILDHRGCAYVNDLFNNQSTNICRESYFLRFLLPYLVIPKDVPASTEDILIVISGMATSSIGLRELPYASLPFPLDGSNVRHEMIPKTTDFPYNVLLLSGICDSTDVMRGEEIQLLGLQQFHGHNEEALFIFPGTHSKHISIKNKKVSSFKTFVTGEIFQLLSNHSLLKNNIKRTPTINKKAFKTGLRISEGNILNSIFFIRANSLLHKAKNTWNYSLLSGLLIGTELKNLSDIDSPIYLCAHGNLSESYGLALKELPIQQHFTIIPPDQIDLSVVYGQAIMAEKYWSILNNL